MPEPDATPAATTTPAKQGPEKFPVEDLPLYAQALGFSAHEIVGAFHGSPATRKVSLEDAKKRVQAWLDGEAETDEAHAPDTDAPEEE